jgi:hypothetical protein
MLHPHLFKSGATKEDERLMLQKINIFAPQQHTAALRLPEAENNGTI